MSWNDFTNGMNKFAIGGQRQWCDVCGNSTGVCASSSNNNAGPAGSGATGGDSSSGGGMSKAVAGVIGAMVALAVIFSVEALVMLIAGLRLVSKKRLGGGSQGGNLEPKD